ncbi:MAG: HTTM domain-containing protein [Planctomycetota bacterium]
MRLIVEPVRRAWKRIEAFWFGPSDPRSYALVRIAYAFAAIVNWFDLWSRRAELFTDGAMVRAQTVQAANPDHVLLSAFFLVRGDAGVTVLFLVAGAAILGLGLGYQTRVCALIAFLWHCSYSTRLIPFDCAHDALFRVHGLVLLISPIALVWSADAQRRGPGSTGGRSSPVVPSYGLTLIRWQVLLLYVVAFWSKCADAYWRDGEALPYFWLSTYSTVADPALARHEIAGAVASYAALFVEPVIPILLWVRRTRWLGFAVGIAFHTAIAATSNLTVFSLVAVSAYPAFLEREDFRRFETLFARSNGRDLERERDAG